MRLLPTLCLLLPGIAAAQNPAWDRAHQANGSGRGTSIVRLPDGGYGVVGRFRDALPLGGTTLTSAGDDDVVVLRYSADGQLLWARRAGGPGRDGGTAIAADASGRLYVAGAFQGVASFGPFTLTSQGGDDVFLAAYDDQGTVLGARQAGGPGMDYAAGVAVAPSGLVGLTGLFQQTIAFGGQALTATGPAAAFVAQYDSQGSVQWAQALPASLAGGLAAGPHGRWYVAGALGPQPGLVTCFDAAGSRRWTTAPAPTAFGTSVVADAAGNVYVGGYFQDSLRVGTAWVVGQGQTDGFVAQFDSLGVGRWVNRLGGGEEDQVRGIDLAGPGAVAVTGYVRGTAAIGGQLLHTEPACSGGFVAGYAHDGTPRWVLDAVATGSADVAGIAFDTAGDEAGVVGTFQGRLRLGSGPALSGGCADDLFTARLTTPLPDLLVSTTQAVRGRYRNITVTAAGVAALDGPLFVTGTLTVQAGGQLDTQCQSLTGPGQFELATEAELRICDPDGLALTGPSGAIQVTGSRTFSPAARYVYSGSQAQQTGGGLPGQVATITVANPAGLTLTQPLRVAQGLRLTAGDLVLAGQGLTLLSDAAGTAQVDNAGGVVRGMATVQRYLDPGLNAGPGYRHLSSPVQAAPVAGLATVSFTPITNAAYNIAPIPSATRPYPTVFGYDETRLTTVASNLPDFDKGYYSPGSPTDQLEVMRGYTVQLAGNQTLDFVGELNNGPYTAALTRGSQADAGWSLLGNPYPSTLDWRRVAVPAGLADAVYVYQSTGPYTGQYRSYVNGQGNPLIALGQGFLVRVSSANSSVSLTLTNAARSADFATAPPLYRLAPAARPVVRLVLADSLSGGSDETTVYFEAGASEEVDAHYDAWKVRPPAAVPVQLSTLTPTGQELSVDGRPVPTRAVAIPLRLAVARRGHYRLTIPQLQLLPGWQCWLDDAATGQPVVLREDGTYWLPLTPEAVPNRFALHFTPIPSSAAHHLKQ